MRSRRSSVDKQLLHKIQDRFMAITECTKTMRLRKADSQDDQPPLPCLFQG
jgi:hypothetical protein